MAHQPFDPRVQVDHDPQTRLVFGRGTIELLGEFVLPLGERPLVVTDRGIADAGHLDHALSAIATREYAVYEEVAPNPSTDDVAACARFAGESFDGRGPDVVIGLGGGSSMDCAKGILFLLSGGGTMHDYRGVGQGRGEFLPLVTVPTTSGTGSEAQSFAVISDAATHIKMACGDKRASARVAILDPDLTLTMPESVTAITGIDAISHAIETFVTSAKTPVSQMYSRQAWRLLSAAFPSVTRDPSDVAARGDMLLGAHLAGAAIEASMLGATHAMANPLTAHFDLTHGVAIASLLPTVIRFNGRDATSAEFYGQMASAVGAEASANGLADWLAATIAEAGLPRSLGETSADRASVSQMAHEASEQMTGRFNPVPMTTKDFEELYEAAWDAA